MIKKKHFSDYYALSLKYSIRIIQEQSINEKPFNLMRNWEKKQKSIK